MASAKTFTIFTKFAVKNGFTGPVLGMAKGADKLAEKSARAADGARKFGGGVKKLGGALMGIGVAAGAASAGILALANGSQKAADDIQNTAAALGISTKALQEYRYVGIQAGLTTEEIDGALTKLTKNLGNGSTEVDRALYQIGVSAEQLRAAGPDKSLELIADGFAQVKDPSVKAAVAMQLFGKSSVRMVNALNGGAKGIKGLRQEAEDIGYVMGGETLQNAGDLNDQLDKLGATAVGLRNRLSAKAIPGLQKLTASLQAGIQPGGRFDKLLDSLGSTLDRVGKSVGPIVDKIIDHLPKFLDFVGQVVESLEPLFKPLLGFIEQVLQVAEKLMPLIIGAVKIVASVLAPVLDAMTAVLQMASTLLSNPVQVGQGFAGNGLSPEENRRNTANRLKTASPEGVPVSSTPRGGMGTASMSQLDVTFGALPEGLRASYKMSGKAPGITLNTAPTVRSR